MLMSQKVQSKLEGSPQLSTEQKQAQKVKLSCDSRHKGVPACPCSLPICA